MAGDALDIWLNGYKDELPELTPLTAIEVASDAIVQMVRPVPYVSKTAKHFLIEEQ